MLVAERNREWERADKLDQECSRASNLADRLLGELAKRATDPAPAPAGGERVMLANALIGWVVTLGNSAMLGAHLTDDGLRNEWHRLVDQCAAFLNEPITAPQQPPGEGQAQTGLRNPHRRASAAVIDAARGVLDAAAPQPDGWFRVPEVAMQALWAAWLEKERLSDIADATPAPTDRAGD